MVTKLDNRALSRDEIRDRIYAAALFLFRGKGYDATTVEEIAQVARVAKGTVFNFFPTKAAILLRAYEEIDAKFGAAMVAMTPEDPKAALLRFWGEAEALLRKEGPLAEAIFRQVALDPDIANSDIDSGDKDRDAMTAFFRDCRAAGTLRAGLEPVVAAHVVGDLWSSTVMDWFRAEKRYSLKLRLGAKLDAIFKGLAPLLIAALLFLPQARAAGISDMQGLYADNQGIVAVTPFAEFGNRFYYVDFAGGRVGPIMSRSGRATIGEGLKDPKSDAGTIAEVQNGLRVEIGGTVRALHPIHMARDPFTVDNGGVKLTGELVRRADMQPKGAVVIVHGSNATPRESYGPWVSFLASRGWTVAVFDKRGTGLSTGDWTIGDFAPLASDVRAVLAYARKRVPGKPVGLVGISQAGWVMPLAAEEGGVDFIVSLAGPAVTPEEQTMETVLGQLEGYGFAPADVRKAQAYYRLDLDVTMGKRPWSDVDAAYKQATADKVEWLVAEPEAENSPVRAFLGHIARFDVGPHWKRVHAPVLAIFGTKDSLVPVNPNRALLAKMLSGNRAARIVVIDGTNHVGMIAKTGTFAEYETLDRFDPVYFKTIGDWLDARAGR